MLKKAVFFLLGAALWAAMAAGWCAGAENRGAKDIVIHAGYRGDVHFPHWQHQELVKDCQVCHSLIPRSAGSIERLKEAGMLGNKVVMNTICLKCHRDRRQAGKPSGPIACSGCHKR